MRKKSPSLSKVMEIILIMTLVGADALMILAPFLTKTLFYIYLQEHNVPYLDVLYYGFLYLMAVLGIAIVWELLRLMKTISNENPFIESNVKGFIRICYYAFGIGLANAPLFIATTEFIFCLLMVLPPVAGLCCRVIAELFRKAIDYKRENDLTI